MFLNLDDLDTLGEKKAPQISDSDSLLLFIDRFLYFVPELDGQSPNSSLLIFNSCFARRKYLCAPKLQNWTYSSFSLRSSKFTSTMGA